jgi:hypothetical protein
VRRASDNQIGDAGAVALAKALESGQCGVTSLDLRGELAARACLRCPVVMVGGPGWG